MIKLAFFLVKYLFSNKYRVIIAFSSKIDYLCFRVIQLCEVWGIRLIDFRNQFVTHPFLSLILQFVNQRDSLNGNNHLLTVRFLKTNSGKKGEGMPVVRNPQFYFREGLCWSDINTTFLKCRIKQKSIHDVKSMSIFGVCDKVPEKYILCVINSTLISYYVDTFVNNTQTFQINDARQLPIIVPTSEQLSFCSALAKAAIAQKIKGNESSNIQKQLDDFIENQIFGLV